jgi:decaprenyl-phosphate phosphoribosyltransferase
MKNLFILARTHHYIKNIIIFAPLFFSGMLLNEVKLLSTFYTFVFFSLAASSVYILNDLMDANEDRQHPKKKLRPVASGAVGKITAVIAMITLLVISITGSVFISHSVSMLITAYVVMNIFYSIWLKHIVILDVTIIAVGFVLRIFVGTAAIQMQTSMWIVLMTFLLSLFLAFAKRRDDVLLFKDGKKVRSNISGYNLDFINVAMSIMASVVLVAYISYTISDEVMKY